MAVNIFRNICADLTTTGEFLYEPPVGYSGIVLSAQVSNITSSTETFSFYIEKSSTLFSLVTDFEVPGNDAATAIIGKLVLTQGDRIFVTAGSNGTLQLVLSLLESQN